LPVGNGALGGRTSQINPTGKFQKTTQKKATSLVGTKKTK